MGYIENRNGDFAETTAFQSDKLARSRTALRGVRMLVIKAVSTVYLGGTRSHSEGCVLTSAFYYRT